MKVEIIVAAVLTGFSIGERHLRSTVLTDESKRILEHFDFSNFDKQEALNYLDRQRYENQIRGKRSQLKFGDRIRGGINKQPDPLQKNQNQFNLQRSQVLSEYIQNAPNAYTTFQKSIIRRKRGRRYKKKRKGKITKYNSDDDSIKDERKYRKKKKKKKRKRRYWNHWSEWSPCSVTCGRGRKIRWRKCIAKKCTTGELEMGEKTCQLPACNLLTKLLGF